LVLCRFYLLVLDIPLILFLLWYFVYFLTGHIITLLNETALLYSYTVHKVFCIVMFSHLRVFSFLLCQITVSSVLSVVFGTPVLFPCFSVLKLFMLVFAL